MDFIVEGAMKQAEEMGFDEMELAQANIKVVGSGGAGNNMVNWLYKVSKMRKL